MTPLDPLSRVLETLRKRISGDAVGKRGRASALGTAGVSESGEKTAADYSRLEDLRGRVVDAIGQIDPQAADREKKAMRILVENVLVWQFGLQLVNDPAFSELVDEVSSTLMHEPTAKESLAALFSASPQ